MRKITYIITTIGLFLAACSNVIQEDSPNVRLGEIKTVPFTDVHFTDHFWLRRMEINRTVSIPSAFHQCDINGRFDNFALAGGLMKAKEHQGEGFGPDYELNNFNNYCWNNRGYSQMVVWTPETPEYAIVKPQERLFCRSDRVEG